MERRAESIALIELFGLLGFIELLGYLVLLCYPGSRRPRPLVVDECASVWPGCRPTGA
jgi:hypothetical protein